MTDVPAGHGYGVVVVFPVLIVSVICMTCCGIAHFPYVFRLTLCILCDVKKIRYNKSFCFRFNA